MEKFVWMDVRVYVVFRVYIYEGEPTIKNPPVFFLESNPPVMLFQKRIVERMSKLIHKQNKFWHITLMLLVMLYYANMVITNQVVAVIGGLYYEDNN